MSTLADALLAINAAFGDAGIPHAFGGAIALGYCIREPRGTVDIDVNVFVGLDRIDEVFDALPHGITVRSRDKATARRDGQVRLRWGDFPVDLFFETHDFHREVAQKVRGVPFEDAMIRVLGCDALVVFKAIFKRPRDWADIEAVFQAGTIDTERVLNDARTLLGPGDPAVIRLSGLAEAYS